MNSYPTGGAIVDYSKPSVFNNPWNNVTPNHGYNAPNPGMSMRQAMLNETKHNTPSSLNTNSPSLNNVC